MEHTADSIIRDTVESLADAFGGHSQYNARHVGEALVGKVNNGGLVYSNFTVHEYRNALAAWWGARWEEVGFTDQDNTLFSEGIRRAAKGCGSRVKEWANS